PLPVHRAAKPLGPAIHPQVARFLASCCEPDDESRVECGALHDAYLAWCAENDVPLCEHTFWRSVAAAGFGPYKTHGVRYRTGLRLVEVK
ncbi:MAG: primase-like DNA-binding domain-containing protein, partial [Patescibacteria group bacterium]